LFCILEVLNVCLALGCFYLSFQILTVHIEPNYSGKTPDFCASLEPNVMESEQRERCYLSIYRHFPVCARTCITMMRLNAGNSVNRQATRIV
jgi:hypothetical protein